MEDNTYDNTDSGVLWQPHAGTNVKALGSINNKGVESDALMLEQKTKDGEIYNTIWLKMSNFYINDITDNPNQPKYGTNKFGERRLAGWFNKKTDGTPYIKLAVSDRTESNIVGMNGEKQEDNTAEPLPKQTNYDGSDDDIPF